MNSTLFTNTNGISYTFNGMAVVSSMCSLHFDSPRRYSAFDKSDNLIYSGTASDTSLPYGSKIYMSANVPWYSSISSNELDGLGDFSSGIFSYTYGTSPTYHHAKGLSASGHLVNDLNLDFVTGSNAFTAEGSIRRGYGYNYVNLTSCTPAQTISPVLRNYSANPSNPYHYTSQEPYIVVKYLTDPGHSGILDMACTYTLSATVHKSAYDGSAEFFQKWPQFAYDSAGGDFLSLWYNRGEPSGILSTWLRATYSAYDPGWEQGLITGTSATIRIDDSDLSARVSITGVAP